VSRVRRSGDAVGEGDGGVLFVGLPLGARPREWCIDGRSVISF
jgi:hypothetical protein